MPLDRQTYMRIMMLLKSLWFPLMHNLYFRESPCPNWSPLGVQFKMSDEHPRPFHMGVPTGVFISRYLNRFHKSLSRMLNPEQATSLMASTEQDAMDSALNSLVYICLYKQDYNPGTVVEMAMHIVLVAYLPDVPKSINVLGDIASSTS